METSLNISRHKTAIRRYAHSKPVALAIGHGLIPEGVSFFDYGCGYGEDVRLLRESGIEAEGWDPYHRPDVSPRSASCVNLGYVLNVIEDLTERNDTLRRAFELANDFLIVSVRVDQSLDGALNYADGYLTSHGSFQKLYTQAEFRDYVYSVLGRRPYVIGLGIAYVFKTEGAEASFVARLAMRPRTDRADVISAFAQDALGAAFVARAHELGRLPLQSEFADYLELQNRFGSVSRLERLVSATLDVNRLAETQKQRREDILTYIAMLRLRGLTPPPVRMLPDETQADIKALWGSYRRTLEEANTFLFGMGKPEIVRGGAKNRQSENCCRKICICTSRSKIGSLRS